MSMRVEIDNYRALDFTGVEQVEDKFIEGLNKLKDSEANWTYLKPLILFLKYCTNCHMCNRACHVYLKGKKNIYSPSYRSWLLKKLKKKRDLNSILTLAESAYRCNLCRRCTLYCPLSIDNGLIAREIRKLFSQELNVAPKEFHSQGSMKQLRNGSSTGLTSSGFMDIVRFIEEDIEERTGRKIKIPVDEKGADMLLIHNAGDYLNRLESIEAFAIILEEADLSWTLSSEAYDAVNYGMWYDDVQLIRIASKNLRIARELDVDRIVVGECGHAHRAMITIADRIDEHQIKKESCIPLLWNLVKNKLNLCPEKNDFPVTLHDPCNIVRQLGIFEPQRKILKKICPRFIEMSPNGFYNYCCGSGGGIGIIGSMRDFRMNVSGKMKFEQIMDVFDKCVESRKYVCAPCSNCKRAISELFSSSGHEIESIGIVDLIFNIMI
ncbi:MAG: (Fe-S)-binding protein [Archaeoglobaceae archaeon]|nr:(Fe-S)-binding protein [Archaeoglobaceae archaeon]MDW7989207.1 (Fe-S)-binding protein [Archaeoglobaceae archaeon]